MPAEETHTRTIRFDPGRRTLSKRNRQETRLLNNLVSHSHPRIQGYVLIMMMQGLVGFEVEIVAREIEV